MKTSYSQNKESGVKDGQSRTASFQSQSLLLGEITAVPKKNGKVIPSDSNTNDNQPPAKVQQTAKVTAIIPTLNEEENIERALESVQFADEIIVVDSFSTDRTIEIAKSFGARILQRKYETAAIQKNWTIPQASHDWIVLLDADEWITAPLQEEIQQVINNEPKEVAFWIGRNNTFMGQRIRYSGWQNDRVIRLFRKSHCQYDDKRVHEEVEADGQVGTLVNRIEHDTYRTFDHYVEKLNRYAWLQAHDYDKKVKRISLVHILVKPPVRFCKHYFLGLGFLDGFPGFMISILQAYAVLTRYAKLWLIRRGIYK